MDISNRTTRLVGLGVLGAVLALRSGAEAANVAHEGFPNAAALSTLLVANGHSAAALTPAQIEGGALMAGGYDVFVLGRATMMQGLISALYAQRVGEFIAAGGHIVGEFAGCGLFFSGWGSDVLSRARNVRPLGLFSGLVRGGYFNQRDTSIDLAMPEHEVVAGLTDPFSDGAGTEIFFWLESADPRLALLATFRATSSLFPLGQDLPVLMAGESGDSRFVFGSWCWSDTAVLAGNNQRMFLNAVAWVSAPRNQPPLCGLGEAIVLECEGGGASVALDGNGASDADGDALSFNWSSDCAQASFDDPASPTPTLRIDGAGACSLVCAVTLTVSDGMASASCALTVTVVDSSAPQVSAALEPQASAGDVLVRISAADSCSAPNLDATLSVGGNVFAVVDGQIVHVDCASVSPPPAGGSGDGAELDPGSGGENEMRLDATALDACGNSASASASLVLGVDLCVPPPPPPPEHGAAFVRGDANGNGHIGFRDICCILRHVFRPETEPQCRDALDVNDDGLIRLDDAIDLLRHLRGGFVIPSPCPEAGQDPSADELDCVAYPSPEVETRQALRTAAHRRRR